MLYKSGILVNDKVKTGCPLARTSISFSYILEFEIRDGCQDLGRLLERKKKTKATSK